ncbi:MAG: GGDEF domain-containing protein [Lysobacter sp.]|nr:GGDEF domain-containing protein [Lysobacter sp.]
MSFQRLRTDFHFGIVILFGVIAVLCIAPFAVYRFVQGQPLAGALDVAIMLCIATGMNYAWRGGSIERAGTVIAGTSTAGAMAMIATVGASSVPWIYVLLVANFLMVGKSTALGLSVLAIVVVALQDSAFQTSLQVIVFVMTAIVVCGFSFVFAYRTESQRQRLEALASHDALTGAYNRRAMERELAVAVESLRRERLPVGLAVMDLDHFKEINDTYGHETGDRVLVDFAQLVAANTRKGDRLFRFGGEEFVLLLRGADAAGLRTSTEELRAVIAAGLRCRQDAISVSIGAAALEPGEDVASWLARADAAMYRAKRDGRNRVVVDEGTRKAMPQGSEAVVTGF